MNWFVETTPVSNWAVVLLILTAIVRIILWVRR